MRKLLLGLVILLVSITPAYAQTIGAFPGVSTTAVDAEDLTAATGTAPFDYALSIGTNGASAFTWQTIYSAAPTTITVLLQGSTDCSTYATIDTSTNNVGEIRSVFGSWRCIRINNTAVTGGAGKTLTVKFVYSTGRMVGSPSGVTSYTGGTFSGPILLPDGTTAAPGLAFAGDTDTGIYYTTNTINFSVAGSRNAFIGAGLLGIGDTGYYSWASLDVRLYRDAAATLALRNSTNPQTFNIYNTYTDASNYERGGLSWSSVANFLALGTEHAGTGSQRGIMFRAGAVNRWGMTGAAGDFYPVTTDAINIGASDKLVKEFFIARSIQGSKAKVLTEGAATAVTQIAVPQTALANAADAVVHWLAYATDGTDTQTRRGSTYLTAVNKAGTETCTVGDIGTTVAAVSLGTLTCTTSCIVGLADVVQFALNCTSSLAQTLLSASARLDMLAPNTVTPQ